MRVFALAILGLVFGLAAPPDARAGVPRACNRPQAEPLACARATREVTHRVMPAARVRALRARRGLYERVVPVEDRQRNRALDVLERRSRCLRC